MSERGLRGCAMAISGVLHLAPWLLLVNGTPTISTPPPPQREVRINVQLLTPSAPPQPVEARQAEVLTRSQPESRQQPSKAPPARERTAALEGEQPASEHAGSSVQPAPSPALPLPAADSPPAPVSIAGAPPAPDAPPAQHLYGASSDQWVARLMARLERYRDYPLAARARRQQGTAWVSATVGRDGQLIGLRLAQSSGQPLLDAAALQTFRRAQPLPPIPADMAAPQEVVVPVEYYLH